MKANTLTLSISKERLAQLPLVTYPGKIIVVNTPEQATSALSSINKCSVVGFDTETKPSFKKGHPNKVALIQVSTGDCCFLFRINKFGLTDDLRDFFENPGILKIGLSLKDDFHAIHRDNTFSPAGFIDLQDIVSGYAIHDCSLQKIYGIVFNGRISKSQRLSNWEAPELTPPQQSYSAIDAWACLEIYHALTNGTFNPNESPYVQEESGVQ